MNTSTIAGRGRSRARALLLAIMATAVAQAANADMVEAVPTAWRLQNYPIDAISVYFTGAVCLQGELAMPPSASIADKDRLWATIMT